MADETDPADPDTEALAEAVVAELDTGTVVDDKIVVSRRGLTALMGAGLGAGALSMLGVDKATAQQAAGQVGTSSSPVDIEAATITASNSITENGQDVVSSPDDDYEIVKDGTDGQGIINFKTQ